MRTISNPLDTQTVISQQLIKVLFAPSTDSPYETAHAALSLFAREINQHCPGNRLHDWAEQELNGYWDIGQDGFNLPAYRQLNQDGTNQRYFLDGLDTLTTAPEHTRACDEISIQTLRTLRTTVVAVLDAMACGVLVSEDPICDATVELEPQLVLPQMSLQCHAAYTQLFQVLVTGNLDDEDADPALAQALEFCRDRRRPTVTQRHEALLQHLSAALADNDTTQALQLWSLQNLQPLSSVIASHEPNLCLDQAEALHQISVVLDARDVSCAWNTTVCEHASTTYFQYPAMLHVLAQLC